VHSGAYVHYKHDCLSLPVKMSDMYVDVNLNLTCVSPSSPGFIFLKTLMFFQFAACDLEIWTSSWLICLSARNNCSLFHSAQTQI